MTTIYYVAQRYLSEYKGWFNIGTHRDSLQKARKEANRFLRDPLRIVKITKTIEVVEKVKARKK